MRDTEQFHDISFMIDIILSVKDMKGRQILMEGFTFQIIAASYIQ